MSTCSFSFKTYVSFLFLFSVGLLAYNEEDMAEVPSNFINSYIKAVSLAMSFIGCLYFLMGICCLRKIRDKRLADFRLAKNTKERQDALNQRAVLNVNV